MASLKTINQYRRKVMQALTRNIGRSRYNENLRPSSGESIKRVFVSRPNDRLGNQLLLTPLLQELSNTFPGCKIDLFVRGGAAPTLFEQYPEVDRILMLPKKPWNQLGKYASVWFKIKKVPYDLAINVIHTSSSGRLSVQFAKATYKCFGDADLSAIYPDAHHMAKHPVYQLRHFLGNDAPEKAVPPLDIRLSADEIQRGKEELHSITQNDRKTILFFTFATGTKCYSTEWWAECYAKMQQRFPDHNLVEVLPVQNVSQVNFVAPSFYSKDLRGIAGFIRAGAVFVGADSGMMHLAAASGTPVLGLFHVTAPDRYAPYGNQSMGVDTNATSFDALMDLIAERT